MQTEPFALFCSPLPHTFDHLFLFNPPVLLSSSPTAPYLYWEGSLEHLQYQHTSGADFPWSRQRGWTCYTYNHWLNNHWTLFSLPTSQRWDWKWQHDHIPTLCIIEVLAESPCITTMMLGATICIVFWRRRGWHILRQKRWVVDLVSQLMWQRRGHCLGLGNKLRTWLSCYSWREKKSWSCCCTSWTHC